MDSQAALKALASYSICFAVCHSTRVSFFGCLGIRKFLVTKEQNVWSGIYDFISFRYLFIWFTNTTVNGCGITSNTSSRTLPVAFGRPGELSKGHLHTANNQIESHRVSADGCCDHSHCSQLPLDQVCLWYLTNMRLLLSTEKTALQLLCVC